MKIGILSDSHGRDDRLQAVLDQFADRDVQAIVHCGDILSSDSVERLARADADAYLVAGNMDAKRLDDLREAADVAGVAFAEDFLAVPIDGEPRLAATHGHLEPLLDELIAGGQFAWVCHGHTHRWRDESQRGVRVLNPGALYHPKSLPHCSAMMLDTDADRIDQLTVA